MIYLTLLARYMTAFLGAESRQCSLELWTTLTNADWSMKCVGLFRASSIRKGGRQRRSNQQVDVGLCLHVCCLAELGAHRVFRWSVSILTCRTLGCFDFSNVSDAMFFSIIS